MIHQAGAKLFYLPSYSPDLNSTEKLWAKVKAFLRKRRALTPEALQRRDRLRLPVLHLLIAETGLHIVCVEQYPLAFREGMTDFWHTTTPYKCSVNILLIMPVYHQKTFIVNKNISKNRLK